MLPYNLIKPYMTYFLGTQSQITCIGFTDTMDTNVISIERVPTYKRLSRIYFHQNPTIVLKQYVTETKVCAQN